MAAPLDLDRLARARTDVLKDEPSARVEVLGTGDDRVVRKTYRNRGLRLLQTWLRTSRAGREFANLRAVERRGIPCTPVLACSSERRLGLVLASTIVTRYLPESRTLKSLLADANTGPTARRTLARALGELLRSLHDAGLLWCTAMPRNVLVLGPAEHGRLAVCDVPAVVVCRAEVRPGLALVDLFDAFASPSRRIEWNATERLRALLAYHRDDRSAARATWRRLARRGPAGQRLRKNLSMALRTYILPRAIHDHAATAP